MANSIHIRNPKVLRIVEEEMAHDIGRNPTETASYLIAEAVAARRAAREQTETVRANRDDKAAASVPAAG